MVQGGVSKKTTFSAIAGQVLPSGTPGQILVANNAHAFSPVSMSGSCTLSASGVINCGGSSAVVVNVLTQGAAGSDEQTTCTTTAGSAHVHCASVVDFAAGQGIRIDGGGTAANLGTPGLLQVLAIGTVPTATATISGGAVTGVAVNTSGALYTAAPTVTFSGGGAVTQATGQAVLVGGGVASVTVLTPGSGYSSPPAVTFSGVFQYCYKVETYNFQHALSVTNSSASPNVSGAACVVNGPLSSNTALQGAYGNGFHNTLTWPCANGFQGFIIWRSITGPTGTYIPVGSVGDTCGGPEAFNDIGGLPGIVHATATLTQTETAFSNIVPVATVIPPWIPATPQTVAHANWLKSSVVSIDSPTDMTLSVSAGSAVIGGLTVHDDQVAFQNSFNIALANGAKGLGCAVYAPSGVYHLTASSNSPSTGPTGSVVLTGAKNCAFFGDTNVSTILEPDQYDAPIFQILNSDTLVFQDFYCYNTQAKAFVSPSLTADFYGGGLDTLATCIYENNSNHIHLYRERSFKMVSTNVFEGSQRLTSSVSVTTGISGNTITLGAGADATGFAGGSIFIGAATCCTTRMAILATTASTVTFDIPQVVTPNTCTTMAPCTVVYELVGPGFDEENTVDDMVSIAPDFSNLWVQQDQCHDNRPTNSYSERSQSGNLPLTPHIDYFSGDGIVEGNGFCTVNNVYDYNSDGNSLKYRGQFVQVNGYYNQNVRIGPDVETATYGSQIANVLAYGIGGNVWDYDCGCGPGSTDAQGFTTYDSDNVDLDNIEIHLSANYQGGQVYTCGLVYANNLPSNNINVNNFSCFNETQQNNGFAFQTGSQQSVQVAASATIASGGSGYALGDLISLTTAGLAIEEGQTVFQVTGVSGGAVTSVAIFNRLTGNYVAPPTNPAAQNATSGSGTGATFNVTFDYVAATNIHVNSPQVYNDGTVTIQAFDAATHADLDVINPRFYDPFNGYTTAGGIRSTLRTTVVGTPYISNGGSGYTSGIIGGSSGGNIFVQGNQQNLGFNACSVADTAPCVEVDGTGYVSGERITLGTATCQVPPVVQATGVNSASLPIQVNFGRIPGGVDTGTSYAVGDTITLAGGTSTIAGVFTVTTTRFGGTGYTSAPTVGFTGGGGSGATATAAISGGAISSVTVTAGGSGYTSAPTITFTGGAGSGASATATISGGVVTAVPGGNVTAVQATTRGNYTIKPSNPVSQASTSGSGTGAAFNVTWFDPGGVNQAIVVQPGLCSSSATTLVATSSTGSGTGASITPLWLGDVITLSSAGGSAQASAQVQVTTLSAGGVVTGGVLIMPGLFSSNPTSPMTQASATSMGTGLQLTVPAFPSIGNNLCTYAPYTSGTVRVDPALVPVGYTCPISVTAPASTAYVANYAFTTGAFVAGDCVKIDSLALNFIDAGVACSGGSLVGAAGTLLAGTGGGSAFQTSVNLGVPGTTAGTFSLASLDGGKVVLEATNAVASTVFANFGINGTVVTGAGNPLAIVGGGTTAGLMDINLGFQDTRVVTAAGAVTTQNGTVTSVAVNNGGTGYASAPTVTFSGGGPAGITQATGTATLTGTAVTAVTVSTPGAGYIVAPTITFTPVSGGTGAVATATIAAPDNEICVNKTVGAATAVSLYASPQVGAKLGVQDCKGDAAVNPITITPAAGNIDGAGSYVINTPWGWWRGIYNGTAWKTSMIDPANDDRALEKAA